MDKPIKAKWDRENQLTKLFFNENDAPELYFVRGSIEWPIGLIPGYALLSAQNVNTKELWIYEEFPFWTVSTSGQSSPLWAWLQDVWKKYLCRYFYFTNLRDHPRFFLQIQREPLIRTHPVFLEAELASKNQKSIDNLILEYRRLNKIKLDQDGGEKEISGNLLDQLMSLDRGYVRDETEIPAVQALRGLLAGIERWPWKRPIDDIEEVPLSYV